MTERLRALAKTEYPPSLALWIALAWVLLIIYASLYPFVGWRIPPVSVWSDALVLAWPRWSGLLDEWLNGLGYTPLGFFLFVGFVHRRRSVGLALLGALLWPALLSLLMEQLQQFLPVRVPSLKDWTLNTAGASVGAMLGWCLHQWGVLQRWRGWFQDWFNASSASGLVLLLLWLLGLLFPTPLPFVLGYPWPLDLPRNWLGQQGLPGMQSHYGSGMVALGILVPALAVQLMVRQRLQKGFSSLYAVALGFLSLSVSTALSVGITHSLSWLTHEAAMGIALAAVVSVLWVWVPPSITAVVIILLIVGLQLGLNNLPSDAYYEANLKTWEQGGFVRFHGLAQWIGWFWPYLSGAWVVWFLMSAQEAKPHSRR